MNKAVEDAIAKMPNAIELWVNSEDDPSNYEGVKLHVFKSEYMPKGEFMLSETRIHKLIEDSIKENL